MKSIFWLLVFCPFLGFSQSIRQFEIIKADSVFVIDSTKWSMFPKNLQFGGISAIEKIDANAFLLVSDRQTPGSVFQDSWGFVIDTLANVKSTYRFYGVENVESVRWNKKMWFSFETKDFTGIGFIDSLGNPIKMESFPMDKSTVVSDNRGIEGLVVSDDLWYAFEMGPNDSTTIVKWPNLKKELSESYKYPLDRKSCLSKNQIVGGSLGNGVSEILDIPGENNRLLVLERCFNGKYAFIKIFEAELSGKTFKKREVFNWDPNTLFQGKPLKPDNMEGMTWSIDHLGKRTLFIVSDDNHNTRHQRTIILQLSEREN